MAYGNLDISGIKASLNSNIDVKNTLVRRLEDCSVSNLVLNVTIDGTTNITITFNKNYTAMTNTDILSEINNLNGIGKIQIKGYINKSGVVFGDKLVVNSANDGEVIVNNSATTYIARGKYTGYYGYNLK